MQILELSNTDKTNFFFKEKPKLIIDKNLFKSTDLLQYYEYRKNKKRFSNLR